MSFSWYIICCGNKREYFPEEHTQPQHAATTESQRDPFDEDELVPRSSEGGEAVLEEQGWGAITGTHFFNAILRSSSFSVSRKSQRMSFVKTLQRPLTSY